MSPDDPALNCRASGGSSCGAAFDSPASRFAKSAGVSWRIVGECDPLLVQPGAPDWSGLESDDRAERVKENPLRRVWRVRYAGRVFYAKMFLDSGFASAVRRLVRRGPEWKEWRAARYAADRNIGCIRLLGFLQPAKRSRRLRAILISEEVGHAAPLADEWRRVTSLDEGGRIPAALRLADCVARLLSDAHRERFLHRDTHPDNILICRDPADGSLRAVFTDLQRARAGRRVSEGAAAANLAELDQWFRPRASASDRLRFLRKYLAYRHGWSDSHARSPGARLELRRFAERVDRAARRHARRLHAQRDRRIFGNNRYFAEADLGGGWTGRFTLRFRRRDLEPVPSQPDRSLDEWVAWVRRELPDLGDRDACAAAADRLGLHLVHEVAATLGRRLVWTLGGSPNRRAFRAGHRRRNRDLPVAAPIALFERRSGALMTESVLLLEADRGRTGNNSRLVTRCKRNSPE